MSTDDRLHGHMIVVTGGAGFIASCLVSDLNNQGFEDIIIVDDFSNKSKHPNYSTKKYRQLLHRDLFLNWFETNAHHVSMVYHLGARTDTTEVDTAVLNYLNLQYSQRVWNLCIRKQVPLIYASSAATYGLGELGFSDQLEDVSTLEPLNLYGVSKNDFDAWALHQTETPPIWFGLKFFNVYGPNEYHKGRMASVILHTFEQIKKSGEMKLFRSHKAGIADGEQSRDFIYIKDVLSMMDFLSKQTNPNNSGIYNIGTGSADTFYHLAQYTFEAMDKDVNISYIDTPEDIRDKYQYFTEADMQKLKNIGYKKECYSLQEGVTDYVQNYLKDHSYY